MYTIIILVRSMCSGACDYLIRGFFTVSIRRRLDEMTDFKSLDAFSDAEDTQLVADAKRDVPPPTEYSYTEASYRGVANATIALTYSVPICSGTLSSTI
jgi:hypothetical protein